MTAVLQNILISQYCQLFSSWQYKYWYLNANVPIHPAENQNLKEISQNNRSIKTIYLKVNSYLKVAILGLDTCEET